MLSVYSTARPAIDWATWKPFRVDQLKLMLLWLSYSTVFSVLKQCPSIFLHFYFLLFSLCGSPERQNLQDGKLFLINTRLSGLLTEIALEPTSRFQNKKKHNGPGGSYRWFSVKYRTLIRRICHIRDARWGGGLAHYRDAVGIFHSSSQLGVHIRGTRWGGGACPLQRCGRYILQLQPIGRSYSRHSLSGSYPTAEMLSVYSTARPAIDWATWKPFRVDQLKLMLLWLSYSTVFSVLKQCPSIFLHFYFLLFSFCGSPERQNLQDGKLFLINTWLSGLLTEIAHEPTSRFQNQKKHNGPGGSYRNPNQRNIHKKGTSGSSIFWSWKGLWHNMAIRNSQRP